jgi:endonuclease/exonuclease/phosphatase family metal-dependent hydrolase
METPSADMGPDEPFVIHKGPIGFVYLSDGHGRRDELAEALAHGAGIPAVLVKDGANGARFWTRDGRSGRLPGDERLLFGADHPFLGHVLEDSLRLVHHRDAGDVVLWSWHVGGAFSFKRESGAHGGPGPRETSAFVLVPAETAAMIHEDLPMRPLDLRALALGALDPGRSRLPLGRRRAEPPAGPPRLRLLTYNVHGCRGMDGRFSVERITRVLARERPDVVCLQELDRRRARSGRFDQVHEIATRLAKSYRFHAVSELDDGHFGNAVLASLPLRSVESGPLPGLETRLALWPRGVLWVEVDVEGVPVQVLNTHLSILARERRLQVEELVDWVERAKRRGPVVLAGDLNSTRDSYVGRRLADVLRDVVEGDARARARRTPRTWSGRVPMIRIDHVFASDELDVQRVEVPRSRLARVASDHLPVVVDLEIAPRPVATRAAGGGFAEGGG